MSALLLHRHPRNFSRHSREGGNPNLPDVWAPACAGVTEGWREAPGEGISYA